MADRAQESALWSIWEALRALEWSHMDTPVWGGSHNESDTHWPKALPFCPLCRGLKPGEECWAWVRVGHKEDCGLVGLIDTVKAGLHD